MTEVMEDHVRSALGAQMRAYRAIHGPDALSTLYDEVMEITGGSPNAEELWGEPDDIGASAYRPLDELRLAAPDRYAKLFPTRIIVFKDGPLVEDPDAEHQRQRNLSLFRNARVLGTLTAADQDGDFISDRLQLPVDRDNARKDQFPATYPSVMGHKFLTPGTIDDVELSPARGLSETREGVRIFHSPHAAMRTAQRWLAHVTETEE